MANELTFEQVSTVLNEVVQQATGQKELAAVDTASFVTVGQAALKMGYDPVIKAISQVISRTLFAVRPYTAHFKGLMVDAEKWGNHVRKLTFISKPAVDSKVYSLTDGSSVDHYTINNAEVVQTNFYGGNIWQDFITRYTDQLDSAFSGPDEFSSFMAGVMTELSNKREQQNESMARAALCNFIGGKMAGSTNDVIHLLTEYKALTGLTLTATDVYKPENYKAFMEWVAGRIMEVCALMTERSALFHTSLTIGDDDKVILRHTPYDRQKVYLSAGQQYQYNARVLADVFHDNYLQYADVEMVNYWQNIADPLSISVYESYLAADGTIHVNEASGASPTKTDVLFGVIFDEEAVGVTTKDDTLLATPVNARGKYTNLWWSANYRWWNDFTENGVVLLLD